MILTIYTDQIKLAVDTETRKLAQMHIASEKAEERLEASLGEEFEDQAFFEQQCSMAVHSLLPRMMKYAMEVEVTRADGSTADGDDGNNDNVKPEENPTVKYDISLNVFSRHAVMAKSLAEAAHSYVVLHILHAWTTMTVPSMAAQYYERREAEADRLMRMLRTKQPPRP